MIFWTITIALALGAAGLLALAMLRARRDSEPAAAYDLRVYRDQLKEVDRDLARGVISEADAERIRAEVSRRILAADSQLKSEQAGQGNAGALSKAAAVVVGLAVVAGSLLLYRDLGAPGYPDLGLDKRIALAQERRAARPGQAEAEAQMPPSPPLAQQVPQDYLELIEKLRETVAERPEDIQGHVLLAQNEANLGNFKAAYEAKAEVIRLKGAEVTAQDHADYAEFLILAAGGYVSPEAEAALQAALQADPQHPIARYYWGLMMGQLDRPDIAFRIWEQLLRQSQPQAPWVSPIRGQIEEMAMRAGVDYTLPPLPSAPGMQAPGPSQADIEAAQGMTPEERMEMIRGMVAGLAERLANEGGAPEEWARLIGALGVLGETEQAGEIWANAREVYAGNDAALAVIAAAARQAGLIQ